MNFGLASAFQKMSAVGDCAASTKSRGNVDYLGQFLLSSAGS